MTFAMKRRAIKLYSNPKADKSTNRHNQIQWLNAVQYLGDKWIISKPINRTQ